MMNIFLIKAQAKRVYLRAWLDAARSPYSLRFLAFRGSLGDGGGQIFNKGPSGSKSIYLC